MFIFVEYQNRVTLSKLLKNNSLSFFKISFKQRFYLFENSSEQKYNLLKTDHCRCVMKPFIRSQKE